MRSGSTLLPRKQSATRHRLPAIVRHSAMTCYCVQLNREPIARMCRIDFALEMPAEPVPLERSVPRFPFVPTDDATLDERCREVYQIQVQGLARRMEATDIKKPVIGVSSRRAAEPDVQPTEIKRRIEDAYRRSAEVE
jgi:hypothetical protein